MSLILEALKKSEAQRRLGETPNLGTPITATRRQRSPLPWITLAVLIATGAGGWLLLRPHATTTDEAPAANVAARPETHKPHDPAQHANATASTKPATPSAGAPAPISVFPPAPAHPAAPPTTAAAAAPGAVALKQPPAAPMSAAVAPTQPPATASPRALDPRAAAKPAADAKLSAVSPDTQKTPAGGNTAAVAGTAGAPAANQVAQATPSPTADRKAATDAAPAAPAEPAIPTIFDLAFSLRHDLPELPVTMQVYSPDPARRFILVGNVRKKEGDQIGDVVVREIRPNGVVLEFRGQRFLLPRPGS